MRKKCALSVFIFTIAFMSGMLYAHTTHAADQGWRWYSNTATLKSYVSIYNNYVTNTRNDYHNNTDMYVYLAGQDPDIALVLSYDPVPWKGLAMPYSTYGACTEYYQGAPTGNCNTTNKKAVSGTIYMRSSNGFPPNERDTATRHELGHIFGMAHEENKCLTSIMSYCNTINLKQFDIDLINSWY